MIQVNLLPWRKWRQRALLKRSLLIFVIYLLAGTVVIIAGTAKISAKNQLCRQTIRDKERQNAQWLFDINRLQTQRQTFDLISERLAQGDNLKQHNKKIVRLLTLLLQWLPEQVWLNQIRIRQHSLFIDGNALSYQYINNFITRAKRARQLENINIVDVSYRSAQQSGTFSYLTFKLEALWQ